MTRPGDAPHERFQLAALVEIALLFGLLAGAGRALSPDNPFLSGVTPHPLWAVVLAVALMHGFLESLTAAACASAVYVLAVNPPPDGLLHLSSFTLFATYREPILFLLAGAVVGEATQLRRRRLANAESENREIEGRRIQTADQMKAALEALRQLETRHATQLSSVRDLHRELTATRDMTPEQVQMDLLHKLTKYLHAGACHYYEPERGVLSCRASVGEKCSGRDHDDPLLLSTLRDKRISTLGPVSRESDMKTGAGHCVLAGPVKNHSGEITAVVSITRIPFVQYTPHNLSLFSIILDWWGFALEEKRQLLAMREKMVVDEETGLYNYSYFRRRVKQEFTRARDFSIPMSLSLLRIANYARLKPGAAEKLRQVVARCVLNNVMEMHMASHFSSDDTVAITFPIVMAEEADTIARSIVEEIQGYTLQPYLESEETLRMVWFSTGYRLGMQSVDELLDAARKGLETRPLP